MNQPKKNNLKLAGFLFLTIGAVTLVCLTVFCIFGNRFLLKPDVEFEPEQFISTGASVQDSITIPGFESMTVSANAKQIKAHLYNPEKNNCYFEISIILSDKEEEIYKSKYIKPGQHLYDITLTRELPAGTYSAVLHYSTYSLDDYIPLNGADVPITLIAE